MATGYPGAVDSYPNPGEFTNTDDPGFELDIVVSNLGDGLEAVQTELGVNPRGGSATVGARIGVVEAAVGSAVPSTRQVIAGTGLTGGGTLAADRTLTVAYGTTAGTAAQGNDSRITGAVPSTRQVTAGTGLTGGGTLAADRSFAVAYGTTAGTAAQGNDSRITGAVQSTRTVAGKALSADITLVIADISDTTAIGRSIATATDGPAVRALIGAGTSNLAIGTAAGTAAQGNDSRIVNAVPNTRTVNGKALSANITITAADVGAHPVTQVINAQTGTTYTYVAADAGKLVTHNNAAATTVTVPANVFAAGDEIEGIRLGAGEVSFAAGAGMTLNPMPAALRAQYSGYAVKFLSATSAVVMGDLA